MALQAVNEGRQLLAHCNGDAAGDQFLRAYEKALEKSTNSDKDKLRPVMIHCQTARCDQLIRWREIGMSFNLCGTCLLLGRYSPEKLRRSTRKSHQPCKGCFGQRTLHQLPSGPAGYEAQYDAFCMVRSKPYQQRGKSNRRGSEN